jgi:hypothetical protein
MYTLNTLVLYVCVGVGAPLQTTVMNRNGPTSCVGDTVIYTCTAGSITHLWRITQPGSNATSASVFPASSTATVLDGAGVITIDDTVNDVITTVLTVTSFAGLNETNILCTDINGNTVQETTAAVFGECCL